MPPPASHPFLELDESERECWIARFLEDPAGEGPYGVRFPLLRIEEPPFTWLTDQFRQVQKTKDLPDRVRRPVVALILNEVRQSPVWNRPQVLGELLEVVGACGFMADGVIEKLRGWVRADQYQDAWYQVFGSKVSVRGKVWSLLIGWHQTEGLIDPLRRDFPRQLDCSQICFAELGRLSPGDAIERIPATFEWHEAYWREVLRRFFNSLGARQATAERYRPAWERCFTELIWNPDKFIFLQRQQPSQDGPFVKLLEEVGILYRRSGAVVRLRPMEDGAPVLEINVEPYKLTARDAMAVSYNEDLVAAGY